MGTIPYVPYYLEKHYVTQGTITGLFGLAAGVLAATVGAILYLYATLVFAYFLIVLLINAGTLAYGSNADAIALTIQIGIPLSMILTLAVAS